MSFTILLIFALFVLCSAGKTTFNVPESPAQGSANVDPAPVAFSFEFFAFPSYFRNVTKTHNCMANLKSLTGTWPRIRIGGTSEDEATFDPTLKEPIEYSVSNPNRSPASSIYGPSFIKLAGSYLGSVVLGLNRGGDNLTNTIEAAKVANAEMRNLHALELGNEPDIYPYLGFPVAPNASSWTPLKEAASEAKWQTAVGTAIDSEHVIQAANFYLPPAYGWSAKELFASENASAIKFIKDFSHHNYPQTVATTTQGSPPNLTVLMSHVNIVANVAPYVDDAKVTTALGLEYVFGETNSVSGGGSPIISPTFGAGLWVLDYSLRAASSNISRIYFHHGTLGSSYYVWWTEAGVTSPYYGGYAATKAMAGGAYISPLDDGASNYAGYVIYSAAAKPMKVVLVNTDFFDGNGTRPSESFILTGLCGEKAMAERLTAASAWSRQDQGQMPSFGGQQFASETCGMFGKAVREYVRIKGGRASFIVAASEALLIEL